MKTSKKSIYIVGTNGLGVNYGGWDKLLSKLIEYMPDNYKLYVYTSSHENLENTSHINNAKPIFINLRANGYQSIFYDFFSMIHAVYKNADIILVLGLSGGIFFPIFKLFKSKVILNPDGAEWKRAKWNFLIKKFLKVSERIGIYFSDHVISDNLIISKEISNSYGITSTIAAYGGDHVKKIIIKDETLTKYNLVKDEYAFKVCRIEPENNIDIILEAFIETKIQLILIGNWNNSSYGKNLKAKYSHYCNLLLLDPIYEQIVLDELRGNCRIYIHGHSVGGTNPSLVEAMHLRLCCLVFDVNYNRETTDDSAIYFKDKNELILQLKSLWHDKKKIEEVKENMYNSALKRYTWKKIIAIYQSVFDQI